MSTEQARTPAGSPDGGQFAATAGAESTTALEASSQHDQAWRQLNNLGRVISEAKMHMDGVALTAASTTLRTVCRHATKFDVEPDEDRDNANVIVTTVHCSHTDPETGKPLARWVRQHMGENADYDVVTNDIYHAVGQLDGMPQAYRSDEEPWWEHSGPGWPAARLDIDSFLASRADTDVPTAVLLDANDRDALRNWWVTTPELADTRNRLAAQINYEDPRP